MEANLLNSYSKSDQELLKAAGFHWSDYFGEWTRDTDYFRTVYKTNEGRWSLCTNYGFNANEGKDNEEWENFTTLVELFEYFN